MLLNKAVYRDVKPEKIRNFQKWKNENNINNKLS